MPQQVGHIAKEFEFQGSKLEVSGYEFSFQFSDKAMSGDQIATQLMAVEVPANGKVWPVEMCNTSVDRQNEVFTKEVLDVFAKQINEQGVTVNFAHNRQIPIGKVLKSAAVTANKTGGYSLMGYVWIMDAAKVPSQSYTVAEVIENGSFKDVSVEVGGTVQYKENPTGGSGVWEYYIDTNRPDATEISGLAICQRGAQRNASVTTKSIGGNPAQKPESKIIDMFKDKFFIKDKEYPVSAKSEGTEIKVEGLTELIADFKASEKAEREAVQKATQAQAEATALKAELKEARETFENDCINYTKLVNKTELKAEDVAKMSVKEIKTLSTALKAEYDAKNAPDKAKTAVDADKQDIAQAVRELKY